MFKPQEKKKKITILISFLACNVLPLLMAQCLPINRIAASSLDSATISGSDILKTISSLDINKAHGHDVLIRMLKICEDAIVELLKTLFVFQLIRPCFLAGGKKLMWFMFIKKTKNIL